MVSPPHLEVELCEEHLSHFLSYSIYCPYRKQLLPSSAWSRRGGGPGPMTVDSVNTVNSGDCLSLNGRAISHELADVRLVIDVSGF